jgi:AcrR family transcriptional regulator
MPRPRSLSHAAIGAAVLAVVDRDGLEALSMRTVAAELGMGPMSLYRYVTGRKEMEVLAVDLIFAAVDPQVDRSASWQQQVTELAWRARAAILAHPAATPLLLAHYPSSASVLRWGEVMLGAFARAGFSTRQRIIGFRSVIAFILGASLNESSMSLTGVATIALAALPPAEYPFMVDAAQYAAAVTPDQEFGQGLAFLLEGLSASLTAAMAGNPQQP